MKLLESNLVAVGLECRFYIQNEIGYKVYDEKAIATKHFYHQAMLAYAGYAPSVGELIKVNLSSIDLLAKYKWAFTTEVIKDIYKTGRDMSKFMNAARDLRKSLQHIGINWEDNHSKNVGFKNDSPVVIDVGFLYFA